MTAEQVFHDYFWHLVALLVCSFYWGYKTGQWWERIKDEAKPESNDEIWW